MRLCSAIDMQVDRKDATDICQEKNRNMLSIMHACYRKNDIVLINLGAVSIRKTVLPGMAIPMLKIRRPNGRLIFNMEIAIRR